MVPQQYPIQARESFIYFKRDAREIIKENPIFKTPIDTRKSLVYTA